MEILGQCCQRRSRLKIPRIRHVGTNYRKLEIVASGWKRMSEVFANFQVPQLLRKCIQGQSLVML